MPESEIRTLRRATWLLLAVAAMIRIALVLQPACIDRNGVQLIEFARRLSDHPIQALRITTRQPGYSIVLLATHRLIGPIVGGETPEGWQRCGEIIALIGGMASCLAIVLLTRRLFDDRVALIAAGLAALWPQGAHLSAGALSDMPHLALFLFAWLIVDRAIERGRVGHMAVGGVVLALAYLIKQEAVCLLAAAPYGWWRWTRRSPRGVRIYGVLAFLAAFAVIISPYSLAAGKFIPNKSPLDLLRIFSFMKGDAPLLAYVVPAWEAPGTLFLEWLRSGRYVIGALSLVGLAAGVSTSDDRRSRRLVGATLLLYAVIAVARAAVYGEISERYAALPLAMTLPWAASGWLRLFRACQRIRPARGERSARVALAVLVGATVIPLVSYVARPVYAWKNQYRLAGQWLRMAAGLEDRILAHEHLEQVLYYAGRTYPSTSWIQCRRSDTVARIARLIRGKHPRWIVDAEGSHRDEIDEAAHFSEILKPSTGLVLEHQEGPAGKQVLIFRVGSPKVEPR